MSHESPNLNTSISLCQYLSIHLQPSHNVIWEIYTIVILQMEGNKVIFFTTSWCWIWRENELGKNVKWSEMTKYPWTLSLEREWVVHWELQHSQFLSQIQKSRERVGHFKEIKWEEEQQQNKQGRRRAGGKGRKRKCIAAEGRLIERWLYDSWRGTGFAEDKKQ